MIKFWVVHEVFKIISYVHEYLMQLRKFKFSDLNYLRVLLFSLKLASCLINSWALPDSPKICNFILLLISITNQQHNNIIYSMGVPEVSMKLL